MIVAFLTAASVNAERLTVRVPPACANSPH